MYIYLYMYIYLTYLYLLPPCVTSAAALQWAATPGLAIAPTCRSPGPPTPPIERGARGREQRLHMPYYIPSGMSFCVSVWVWGYLNRVVGGPRGIEGQPRGHATHRASCRYHTHTETGDVHTQVRGAEVIGQEMRSQDARCASGQDLGRDFRGRAILPTLSTHLPGTTGHRSSRRSP